MSMHVVDCFAVRYTNHMNPAGTSFRKSFDVLNSVLSLVFAAYLLDVTFARFVYLDYEIVFIVFIFLFKCFIMSGIYGSLIEIISLEKTLLSFPGLFYNAKRYFFPYLLILAFCLSIHFAFVQLLPSFLGFQISKELPPFLIIFLAMMGYFIVYDKYIKPLGLNQRRISIGYRDIKVLFLLYLTDMLVYNLLSLADQGKFDFEKIALIVSQYIHSLEFIFIAQVIVNSYIEIKEKYHVTKELILINPASGGLLTSYAMTALRNYPPFFVVLKAFTPKNYAVRTFNRIPWRRRYFETNAKDTLVAITCYTSNAYEAYYIASEYKKRGCKVVLGGPHVTYLPEESLAYCDSVIVGEAEGVWREVIEDFESGTLKPKYLGSALENFHAIVQEELMNSPPEIIKDFLETQRGCKFRCHFCTIPGLSQGQVRRKPIGEVVELIKKIRHKYKTIIFIDNDIYSDPQYARELFKALKPLNINWQTQCTIDIAKNDETLRLAKESGCKYLLIGYEIFGDSQEKDQKGKFAMAQRYKQYTEKIKAAGIAIKAHFIFGFDTDTFRSMLSMWRFCFSIKPMVSIMSVLTPLPGSQVYYDFVSKDRIRNLNWRKYTCQNLVFDHPRMDSRKLSITYPLFFLGILCTTSIGGFLLFCIFLSSMFL